MFTLTALDHRIIWFRWFFFCVAQFLSNLRSKHFLTLTRQALFCKLLCTRYHLVWTSIDRIPLMDDLPFIRIFFSVQQSPFFEMDFRELVKIKILDSPILFINFLCICCSSSFAVQIFDWLQMSQLLVNSFNFYYIGENLWLYTF